jgi:hypothetical protein
LQLLQLRDYWHTAEDHERHQICLQEPSPLSWLPMMPGNLPQWLGTVHNISKVQLTLRISHRVYSYTSCNENELTYDNT